MEVQERPRLALSDLTYDQLAVTRIKLSDRIKEAEAVVDGLKEKREKLDIELLKRFNEQGVTNVKTAHGTPYIITRESYPVEDKDSFRSWMQQHDAYDYLEMRVVKAMIDTFKETNGDLPPGIGYSARRAIGFKKS